MNEDLSWLINRRVIIRDTETGEITHAVLDVDRPRVFRTRCLKDFCRRREYPHFACTFWYPKKRYVVTPIESAEGIPEPHTGRHVA